MCEEKKYFHEISDEEYKRLVEEKKTYGYLYENYKQPSWCSYPNALGGSFGCWSLMGVATRKEISEEKCKNCDCFNKM